MKVLTVKQPWAFLIVKGLKDVENRSWFTSHQDIPLLIHTGKTFDWDALPFIQANHGDVWQTIAQQFHLLGWVIPRREITTAMRMQFGTIIGRVNLEGCYHYSVPMSSRWAEPGFWHWKFSGAEQFEQPIKATGHQGLWEHKQ